MALDLTDVPAEIVTAHFEPVEFHMYVPNAFTPDNDGVNDAFHPLGSGYEGEMFWYGIFNRWGELVFESTDSDVSWYGQDQRGDGTHFVPDGVYGYSVNVKGFHDLVPTFLRGTVTVVR